VDTNSISNAVAFVSFAGFAIQQALQILQPLLFWLFTKTQSPLSDDGKKALMGFCSFVVAFAVVETGHFNVFSFLEADPTKAPSVGLWLTAVVLSAGTEGANSIQKFLAYIKDAKAPGPPPAIVLFPTTVTVPPQGIANLLATVTNAKDRRITWKLIEAAGGDISQDGVFKASNAPGTYHVVAMSSGDSSLFATATIQVGT
jgi:hypothetical protein